MANKKYYWLKLKRDFFKRHDIRIIEEMPNGKDYILFYLKLLLESIDHEGNLRFSDAIPYNEQMLSVVTNTNVDIVKAAMNLFIELNMIEVFDDQTIYMNEVEKLIGSETASAERVRRHRLASQTSDNALQCNTVVTTSNDCVTQSKSIEKDKDKELDLDKEIEKEKKDKPSKPPRHKYGLYNNVLLSDEDMEKLKVEFPSDYQERIDRLSEYIESKGAKYKNHLATIRAWDRRYKEKHTSQPEQPKKQGRGNFFIDMMIEEGYTNE